MEGNFVSGASDAASNAVIQLDGNQDNAEVLVNAIVRLGTNRNSHRNLATQSTPGSEWQIGQFGGRLEKSPWTFPKKQKTKKERRRCCCCCCITNQVDKFTPSGSSSFFFK